MHNKKIHLKRIIRQIQKKTVSFVSNCYYHLIPDKLYYIIQYYRDHHKFLSFSHPSTIDEKLQWIKLFDRKPIYHVMIDKIKSKSFVTEVLGTDQYIVPLLGVWDHYSKIDFNKLPEKFVLKCNHDSYSWIIVRDKSKINHQITRNKLEASLSRDYYYTKNKQWGYKRIKPQIMAETLLEGNNFAEYQLFCNNGIPQFVLVRTDLGDTDGGYNICYSLDWQKLDYRIEKYPDINLPRPAQLEQMISISHCLSKNTLHLRVDFFIVDERLYVGEMTFYSNGGNFHNFTQEAKDHLCDTLTLPIY